MDYTYQLDVLAGDGRSLERAVVSPDWKAALAWVHFEGIRAGQLPAVTVMGPSRVEPIWDPRSGPPAVSGFRVVVGGGDGEEVAREIPRTYVRAFAQDIGVELVKKGTLKGGDVYTWTLSAYPAAAEHAAGDVDGDFTVEDVPQPLPLDAAPLDTLLARAMAVDMREDDCRHVPVFVPQRVLDEAVALSREAHDVETGGILVGKLYRDAGAATSDAADLFLEVTAQIPAPHTISAATKLTFTGETWAAVRAALALRRQNEAMLGWWHYHPSFCRLRACPPERRAQCDGANPFFSADDVQLHATCFPAGHHIALLISEGNRGDALARSLFGWWQGMVVARGFHVLGGTNDATNTTGAA
jgi:hypothetical protein